MTNEPLNTTWKPQPVAAEFVSNQLREVVNRSPWLTRFEQRLLTETGTQLLDWVDYLMVDVPPAEIVAAGFESTNSEGVFSHFQGMFPTIVQTGSFVSTGLPTNCRTGLAIRVDCLSHALVTLSEFQAVYSEGTPGGPLSFAAFHDPDTRDVAVRFVERHGNQGLDRWESLIGISVSADELSQAEACLQQFKTRPRTFDIPHDLECARVLYENASKQLDPTWACDLFFRAEREYWQSRNRAAQIQYKRQQALGLGWANHDHHTYRCSRRYFADTIALFEQLGFLCRERFFPGHAAGWGAQVLEHPACGIVIFADVDLTESEVRNDFAHEGLTDSNDRGTVGLWCELHGDSISVAGMHHLECQFHFDAATKQLHQWGVESMSPFTDLPYLKQAFTTGERWPVDAERLQQLAEKGWLSQADVRRILNDGAIGSHLEILQRNDGYKGFNQAGITHIIGETDPRKA